MGGCVWVGVHVFPLLVFFILYLFFSGVCISDHMLLLSIAEHVSSLPSDTCVISLLRSSSQSRALCVIISDRR